MTATERLVDLSASVENVWSVVTDAQQFEHFTAYTAAEFEPTEGSAMRLETAAGTLLGRVTEVVHPSRFAYRLSVEPDVEPEPATSTLVEFTLSPAQVGSRLLVRESGFGSLDDRFGSPIDLLERAGETWNTALERLEAILQ